MTTPSHGSATQLRSRLPTELNLIIIALLPVEDLLRMARVCLAFQLGSEPLIYRKITITRKWEEGRFVLLQKALTRNYRRCSLIRELYFLCFEWPTWPEFWAEAVGSLLSCLSNVKSLMVPGLRDEELTYSQFFVPSRLESCSIRAIEYWDEPLDFFRTQPNIRKLCVLEDNLPVPSPLPSVLLPKLEELECDFDMLPIYAPGRPISKVCFLSTLRGVAHR